MVKRMLRINSALGLAVLLCGTTIWLPQLSAQQGETGKNTDQPGEFNGDGRVSDMVCTVKIIECDRKLSGVSAHFDPLSSNILVFGAAENTYAESEFKDWIFESESLLLEPSAAPAVFKALSVKGEDKPSARSYVSSTFLPDTRRVLLFGGFQPDFLDDLWSLDIGTSTWTQLSGEKGKARPAQRDAHATFVGSDSNHFYVFGGLNRSSVLNDLWRWDIKKKTWEEIKPAEPSAPWPELRLTHRMLNISPDTALMFGGLSPGFESLAELWSFDTKTDRWQRLADAPVDLAGPALVWHPKLKAMLVLGGSRTGVAQDSILAYEPATKKWSHLGKLKQPIAHAAAAYDSKRDRITLIGGTQGFFMSPHPQHMIQELEITRK